MAKRKSLLNMSHNLTFSTSKINIQLNFEKYRNLDPFQRKNFLLFFYFFSKLSKLFVYLLYSFLSQLFYFPTFLPFYQFLIFHRRVRYDNKISDRYQDNLNNNP